MGRRATAVLAFSLLVVAARAVPALAQPSFLVSVYVDDSVGNNNGYLESGESALLEVSIQNSGDQDATNVTATVSTTTVGAHVTDAGPKTYGTLTPDAAPESQKFGIATDPSYPCGNNITFTIAISSDQGATSDQEPVEVQCPTAPLTVASSSFSDADTHQTITSATVGEKVDLVLQLSNIGQIDATNVVAHLFVPGADVTVPDATYGTIAKTATQTGTFQLVPSVCPEAPALELFIDVKSDQSADQFTLSLPVECHRLGVAFIGGTWDDRVGGNGDGFPQPGETGFVLVRVTNKSDVPVTGVTFTLTLHDADVSGGPISVPDIEPGATVDSTTPFTVKIHDDANLAFGGTDSSVGAPGCEARYPLSGFSLDNDQRDEFSSNIGILESGSLLVSSDQGSTSGPIASTAVCAETISQSSHQVHHAPKIAATGGRLRLDLLWFGLAFAGWGAILRRVGRSRRYL